MDPGADLLAALDPAPRLEHAFGIDLATWERGRDAVGEKHDRIDRVFVDALLAEQVDRVVRVQVEEPRQDRLVGGEPDDLGAARVASGQGRPDLQEDAAPDENPRVRNERVPGAAEQLPAEDDDVSGLDGRNVLDLAGRARGRGEQGTVRVSQRRARVMRPIVEEREATEKS